MARERSARTLALLVAGVLVASTCASESDRPLGLPGGGEIDDPDIVYVYDGHGRLQAVTDPTGDTAVYARDAAGNVTGIERYGTDEPSIIEVTPRRAARGDHVTVHGTGFGEGGDGSTVTIGGAEAEISGGSPFSLTVVVPRDAPAGDADVAVETPSGPVATDITLAVREHGAPTITGFSPAVATPGAQVTIEGNGFADDPLLDAVVLGGATYARGTSATETELVVELPATATTGRISVATPDGTGRSDDELFVVPASVGADAIALTSRADLGDATAIDLDDDEVAVIAFAGRRGQHVGVDIALAEGEEEEGRLGLDPFRTTPDVTPVGWLNDLRRPAYGASRQGRTGDALAGSLPSRVET